MATALSSPSDEVGVKIEIDQHDSKPALTPPTSESTGKKDDDDSGSELSELEPEPEESIEEPAKEQKVEDNGSDNDDDDGGEILPDHYYEGGEVPVFKPVSTLQLSMLIDCEKQEQCS